MAEVRVGILSASDASALDGEEDSAGKALVSEAEARGWLVVAYHVCPDDEECLQGSMLEMADVDEAELVLTIGGTGLEARDVTPEATLAVCERMVPGIAETIRAESLKASPDAMLSRGVAGTRGDTLIVNLPGGEARAREAFAIVADRMERAVETIAQGRAASSSAVSEDD